MVSVITYSEKIIFRTQVLQVDNQEVNLFRDRPEERPFGAVTEQALEAFMNSGIMEQNSTSQEVVLPQAAEVMQVQTLVVIF